MAQLTPISLLAPHPIVGVPDSLRATVRQGTELAREGGDTCALGVKLKSERDESAR